MSRHGDVAAPDRPGDRAAVEAAGECTRRLLTPPETGYLATVEALDAVWVPATHAVVLADPARPDGRRLRGSGQAGLHAAVLSQVAVGIPDAGAAEGPLCSGAPPVAYGPSCRAQASRAPVDSNSPALRKN